MSEFEDYFTSNNLTECLNYHKETKDRVVQYKQLQPV